jgi:ribonucleoside-diphosphate reductase alpha chain
MNLYKQLSEERKQLQSDGLTPDWMTTAGYQLFKEKYLYEANNIKEQFQRIAKTAAGYIKHVSEFKQAEEKFFELLWNGWLSPSTPVLANCGTNRGLPVSCSGGVVSDSIEGFYDARKEVALLTKYGFGTSNYLGGIRPRGSAISSGGKASGVLPELKAFIQVSKDVSQGGVRRGSWAGYLEITHGDFDEVADFVLNDPDNANIGWIITDEFVKGLTEGNQDYLRRYQKSLKLKMVTGRGYFTFIDKSNRKRPQMYKDHGLVIKASNLCEEIRLFSDDNHTYTCVLSSMNVAKYDEWKDTDAVYWSTVFLDCIAEDLIQKGSNIKGLEKAVRFTKKSRALGLGQCGFHTYLQKNMIPFESLDASFLNRQIAKRIWDEASRASKEMATLLGEPEWCKGYGVRNSHFIAIAPTKSCVSRDTKFITKDFGAVDYDEFLALAGLNLDDILSYEIEMEDGSVVKLKFDDKIKVNREGVTQVVLSCELKESDDIIEFLTK